MAKINIDQILNVPDELIVNGKTFLLRELTVKERIGLIHTLREVIEEAEEAKKNPEAASEFYKRLENPDSSDFKFIKAALDPANPVQPFVLADFENLSNSQIAAIFKKIHEKNNFLAKIIPAEVINLL